MRENVFDEACLDNVSLRRDDRAHGIGGFLNCGANVSIRRSSSRRHRGVKGGRRSNQEARPKT